MDMRKRKNVNRLDWIWVSHVYEQNEQTEQNRAFSILKY